MGDRLRILHVTTDLEVAGAQVVLRTLVEQTPSIEHRVVSLKKRAPLADDLRALGVTVDVLGLEAHPVRAAGLPVLVGRGAPDVVQTWMYHADVAGGLAALVAGRPPVVWGMHHVDLDRSLLAPGTYRVARIGAWLSSRLPTEVVWSSAAARRAHVAAGYADRGVVIRNGFSTVDVPAGTTAALRRAWSPAGGPIVGRFGRWHPQKDWPTFAAAAGRVARARPDVRFVMAGPGIEPTNGSLTALLEHHGVGEHAHLLGLRRDMPALHAALDVEVSSSRGGESAPMVIGEALAAGTPVVTTDVGDSAAMVGDAGVVVPPARPDLLADGVLALLAGSEAELSARRRRARAQAVRELGVGQMVDAYTAVWRRVAG